jgi:hypothetical protein
MARSLEKIREIFPLSDNCFELQKTIDKVMNEKQFYASKLNRTEMKRLDDRQTELNNYFTKINCKKVVSSKKIQELDEIASKYQAVDKDRIESENKPKVRQRIYIGLGILLVGLSVILITNRKK